MLVICLNEFKLFVIGFVVVAGCVLVTTVVAIGCNGAVAVVVGPIADVVVGPNAAVA